MTKKEKTKLIVWSCIGVAVLAAILLFFFMPRRGDKLLRLPDAESVYGLYEGLLTCRSPPCIIS